MVKQHVFSAVEKILWDAALEVTGRSENASKLVMDKPMLALAVRKSRRKVSRTIDVRVDQPSSAVWRSVSFFSSRTTGRRFVSLYQHEGMSRRNSAGYVPNPYGFAIADGPMYVYWQLR